MATRCSGYWPAFSIGITFSATPGVCAYWHAYTGVDNDSGKPKVKIRKDTGLGMLQDYSFGTSAHSVSVANDPNTNRLLLAWEEQGGTNKDIMAQMIDLSNFVNYGTPISVSTVVGDQSSPAAAFDNVNQRFLVIWEDARNQSANISNIDIYGQFVDPQGNLSGGNTPVTVASGNQLAPSVAFGDVDFRQFFAVWKDGRDAGNSDLFGQLFEYSELPQLLIEDADGNPIVTGAIDFGNVVVGQTEDIGIKICNNGNMQLTIESISIPDAPYSFLTPRPQTISPATCFDMTVRFAPTAAGSYAGTAGNRFKTEINSTGGHTVLYFSGNGTGIEPLSITTTSLEDGSLSSPYSAALSAYGGVFPYAWSVSGQTVNTLGCPANAYPLVNPNIGLCLDRDTGVISGTPTVAGTYTFAVQVTDNNSPTPNTATRMFTLEVSVVSITTASLKQWTQGIDYGNAPAETMQASGGVPPYSWSISTGSLPTGMSINAGTGLISGIPGASGIFSFTVMVTDSAAQTATKDLSITINPTPFVLTSSLSFGVVGIAYSQTVFMTGGTSPITWAISSGSLFPGITFNSGTGVISGTPTALGTFSFTVRVTDSTGAFAAKGPRASAAPRQSPMTARLNRLVVNL